MLTHDQDGAPWAYGSQQDGDLWLEVPGVATFHLPSGGATLTATVDDAVESDAVLDAYYGTALPLIIQATRGLEVLHGSAVLAPARRCVVAFCGMSEAGKSTIAYGLAARGYSQWADDAVAFRVDAARSVNAVGLPFTAQLRESSAAYFQASEGDLPRSVGDLTVVEDFAWKPARLGAVFLLEPSDPGHRTIEIERLTPGRALHALLSNAYQDRFQPERRERRQQTLQAYLELVASVPVLSARFPRELDRLPDLLDEVERWMPQLG